jgi:hypothetical protein
MQMPQNQPINSGNWSLHTSPYQGYSWSLILCSSALSACFCNGSAPVWYECCYGKATCNHVIISHCIMQVLISSLQNYSYNPTCTRLNLYMHKTWPNGPCCHGDHPLLSPHHLSLVWPSPSTSLGTSSSVDRWLEITQSKTEFKLFQIYFKPRLWWSGQISSNFPILPTEKGWVKSATIMY